MDSCDPTGMLFAKIRSLEPDYASKIIGYLLLQDFQDGDLMRLVACPDAVLKSLILKVKCHLGLPSNTLSSPSTPPSPSPLNFISRPPLSSRTSNPNGVMDFGRNNPSSPSSNSSWSLNSVNPNENSHISPKASPFLSFDTIHTSSFSNPSVFEQNNDGSVPGTAGDVVAGEDFLDDQKLSDYLSFLDDSSSRTEEFADSTVPLGYSVSSGDAHLHRRSFSASDACLESNDGGFGVRSEPCMYFGNVLCKDGDSSRFVHGGFAENVDGNGPIVGSPSKMDGFYRQHEEMVRMKLAYQQRLAASQFMPRVPHLPYENRTDFLLPTQAHRGAAFPFGDEQNWCSSPGRLERNELLGLSFGDQSNSASRQIYLTFPADSTFKDEDVATYFSIFGAVQDVRIPYQQKRMFGFVSFVHPETVKLVLARGNPHFICDSRVLVKPYKEKGKVLDKKQQHLPQQHLERGSFSPCTSPSEIDPREPCDLPLGEKMIYYAREMMRRKREQADLHRAIELERRRFMNLQLPPFKNELTHHHQRSLSIGSHGHLSSFFNENPIAPTERISQEGLEDTAQQHSQEEAKPVSVNQSDCNGGKSDDEGCSTIELVLPSTFFASTKSADDHQTDESVNMNQSNAVSAATGENLES